MGPSGLLVHAAVRNPSWDIYLKALTAKQRKGCIFIHTLTYRLAQPVFRLTMEKNIYKSLKVVNEKMKLIKSPHKSAT